MEGQEHVDPLCYPQAMRISALPVQYHYQIMVMGNQIWEDQHPCHIEILVKEEIMVKEEEIKVDSWMECCGDQSAGTHLVANVLKLAMAMGTGFPLEVYHQHVLLACVWCVQFYYESIEGNMSKKGWEDEHCQAHEYCEYVDFGWVALRKDDIVVLEGEV